LEDGFPQTNTCEAKVLAFPVARQQSPGEYKNFGYWEHQNSQLQELGNISSTSATRDLCVSLWAFIAVLDLSRLRGYHPICPSIGIFGVINDDCPSAQAVPEGSIPTLQVLFAKKEARPSE
jgi:hypothetical protein